MFVLMEPFVTVLTAGESRNRNDINTFKHLLLKCMKSPQITVQNVPAFQVLTNPGRVMES